jgi:hypothetical protein
MTDNTERWAEIEGYNGDYEVSTHGRVMSFKRDAGGRLMSLRTNTCGYLIVDLCANCERKSIRVHRLAAEAFIHNPDNKPQVNHINGVKTDNRLENLEWATSSENVQHSFDTGLLVAVSGEKHYKATVSDEMVRQSIAEYATGKYTQEEIAKMRGVHRTTVGGWVRNEVRVTA